MHLQLLPEIPAGWRDDALAARWATLRELRRVVTGAIEIERGAKRIGSSLQAHAEIFADRSYLDALQGLDLAEICITSSGVLHVAPVPEDTFTLPEVPGVGVRITPAPGEKCQRCWKVLVEVGSIPAHPELCRRCADAVERLKT